MKGRQFLLSGMLSMEAAEWSVKDNFFLFSFFFLVVVASVGFHSPRLCHGLIVKRKA